MKLADLYYHKPAVFIKAESFNMKLKSRYIPYGDLPYGEQKFATHMVARLYGKCPGIAQLPNIYPDDNIVVRTLQGMPGVCFKDGKIVMMTGTQKYEHEISLLDKAFSLPNTKNLKHFASEIGFLEKYLQIIKKFQSPNAVINLLGPFTVSQMLLEAGKEQMLADKSYRKLFIQAVCVKALWIMDKIKEYCPSTVPVVLLEETMLGQLGVVKRSNEDITTEVVVNMLSKVIEKLKSSGAIVGVQCFEKCDWAVPIQAGADLISFDSYNNPNNLHVITEQLKEYLQRGGMINWACVPTVSEENIKSLTVDYLSKRLFTTIENLFLEGVPLDLLYRSATVSLNAGTKDIPAMFAEKINMILIQIADRLAVKI